MMTIPPAEPLTHQLECIETIETRKKRQKSTVFQGPTGSGYSTSSNYSTTHSIKFDFHSFCPSYPFNLSIPSIWNHKYLQSIDKLPILLIKPASPKKHQQPISKLSSKLSSQPEIWSNTLINITLNYIIVP